MSAPIDPLVIQPSQVQIIWKCTKPSARNGGTTFIGRIEAIATEEAARIGYDLVEIRATPHDTTSVKPKDGDSKTEPKKYTHDEMHLTVRFISKYFASLDKYERTVHIPVNLYDPATRTFTNYEMNAKLRGRDYPYGRLAKERDPEYSYLVENPFPKTLRQQGNDHTTRKGGRAGTPSSRPGTPSARPGTPTSRPGSSQGRAATPTGRPAPTTTTTGRPGTTSTSRPGTSSGLRPGSRG